MRTCQACDERVRDTGGGKPAQASEAVRGVPEGCEYERARASEGASERRGLRSWREACLRRTRSLRRRGDRIAAACVARRVRDGQARMPRSRL